MQEIFRALSTDDFKLIHRGDEVELRRRGAPSVRLPLRIIRRRGPDAIDDMSRRAFNLFVDAGPRLTKELRENPVAAPGMATSSGLLRVRTGPLFVDVEKALDLFPAPSRRGPKLQGKSELVAEALSSLKETETLPSISDLAKLASGLMSESVSVSQTQKVLARLEEDGVVKAERSRGPKYTQYFGLRKDELLRSWAREYLPGVARTMSLYVTARHPDSVLKRLKKAELGGLWAIRGPSAAQLWRPTLLPSPPIEIWVDAAAWDDLTTLGGPVDTNVANLTVRRLAGRQPPLWWAHMRIHGGLPVVSPARAFVETAASRGPRFDELADALFETVA